MTPRAVLTLVLLLVPRAVLAAEPRTDRNGDPLPDGAVARFGSARLLHGGVEQLHFSPDGKTLASSGGDGVRLWDVATGKVLPQAHLPQWDHAVFAFTPDGGHLVGDADGCRLIDPATGKVRCSWQNGGRTPRSITVSADGKTAAVVWDQGGVTAHNLTRGGPRDDWKISDDAPSELYLSGDGSLLAYYNYVEKKENAILLWDTRRGKRLHGFASAEAIKVGRLYAYCLSRDGKRLAASWGDKLLIWDTASHEEVLRVGGKPLETLAIFLRFTADGKEVVGANPDRRIRRWSAATGKVVAETVFSKEAGVVFWQTALSPDGRTIAAHGHHGAIRLWDTVSGKETVSVERWPAWGGAAFVKPGVVATWTRGEKSEVIAFWDATDGRLLRKRTIAVPESGWWRRSLSPDGKLFATENEEKGVLLYDVESGKELRHFDVPRRRDEQAKFAFSPDSKSMVITDERKGLAIYSVETGKALSHLEGVSDGSMAFSPDGRTVASAFVSRFILTEVASGKARFKLPLPESQERERSESCFDHIRFSRNGRVVAAVSRCDILVFSTTDGKTLLHLERGERTNLWSETGDLSPDGRWLAHGDDFHGAVPVRDLKSPRAVSEYQTLHGHGASVEALAFSPDGKYLVSAGPDGTALVWDAKQLTGKPLPPRVRKPSPEIGGLAVVGAEVYWVGLADADAAKAALAMADLGRMTDEAVPLLKARLKPAAAPPAERVERLIADLDSDTFDVRQKAFRELRGLHEQAAPALRKALKGTPSAELARQARQLLSDLDGPITDPERLRPLRAVEVLERLGTPAAKELLEALAKGDPDARLTQDAQASLERLSNR
jgi:WD40 repeat protein